MKKLREISIGSVEQRASDQPARHRKKKEFIEKRKKQENIDFSENGKMDYVNFRGGGHADQVFVGVTGAAQ